MPTAPKPRPKVALRDALRKRYPAFAEVELDQVAQDIHDALRAGLRAAIPGRQQKQNLAAPLAQALEASARVFRRRAGK